MELYKLIFIIHEKNHELIYWWENKVFYECLCQLLQDMLEPDPEMRISSPKALERFDELNKIRKIKKKNLAYYKTDYEYTKNNPI